MARPVVDLRQTQKPAEEPVLPVRKRKGWGGWLLGIIAGLAALAATRLGFLWPNFDVLANLTPQALFWLAAFALAAIVPRYKTLAAHVLFALMITGWGIRSYRADPPPVPPVAAENTTLLHIGHYNTHAENGDIAAVEEQIRAMNADVISILEAKPDKLPMIDRLKDLYPYSHGCIGIGKCETAILSKYPFQETDPETPAPRESLPSVWVRFGPELGNLTFIAIHAQRFPNLSRQWSQVGDLRRLVESMSGNIIVAGDFNATPYSRVLTEAAQGTGLTRLTDLPTWHAGTGLPQLAIDHFLVSNGIAPASAEYAGLSGGSDHLPIHMFVQIAKP